VQLAATTLALAVMRLAGPQHALGPARMALVVGAAAVWLVVTSAFVWVVLAIVENQPVWQSVRDGIGFRMVLWSSMVALGLLCGLATSAYRWAVLLAVLPLAVLEVVLAGTLRARQERQQLDGLLQAAAAAHSSVQPADVEDAVLGSARELLLCRHARLTDTPPGEGELGCRLPGPSYPERWLVVSDRRGVDPFGAHDVKLLEALAGVSASALTNAGLVEQLKHEAFHDALTGLPNQLLREVARRLTGAVRTGDTVARMSGDEFTVLVTGLRSTGEAAFVAEKVMAVFRAPFLIAGQELHVTPSLGIAVAPEDGTRPSVLLKNADTA